MDKEYVEKLVDQIIDNDNVSAKQTYDEIMATRITDALEAKKKEVAQSIYNDSQEELETEEETQE